MSQTKPYLCPNNATDTDHGQIQSPHRPRRLLPSAHFVIPPVPSRLHQLKIAAQLTLLSPAQKRRVVERQLAFLHKQGVRLREGYSLDDLLELHTAEGGEPDDFLRRPYKLLCELMAGPAPQPDNPLSDTVIGLSVQHYESHADAHAQLLYAFNRLTAGALQFEEVKETRGRPTFAHQPMPVELTFTLNEVYRHIEFESPGLPGSDFARALARLTTSPGGCNPTICRLHRQVCLGWHTFKQLQMLNFYTPLELFFFHDFVMGLDA